MIIFRMIIVFSTHFFPIFPREYLKFYENLILVNELPSQYTPLEFSRVKRISIFSGSLFLSLPLSTPGCCQRACAGWRSEGAMGTWCGSSGTSSPWTAGRTCCSSTSPTRRVLLHWLVLFHAKQIQNFALFKNGWRFFTRKDRKFQKRHCIHFFIGSKWWSMPTLTFKSTTEAIQFILNNYT